MQGMTSHKGFNLCQSQHSFIQSIRFHSKRTSSSWTKSEFCFATNVHRKCLIRGKREKFFILAMQTSNRVIENIVYDYVLIKQNIKEELLNTNRFQL